MAIGFESFGAALKSLPAFIGGFDPFHHKTVDDLRFLVQHEIDLYMEGESNELTCPRLCDTHKRLNKCRSYIARCKATTENDETTDRKTEQSIEVV